MPQLLRPDDVRLNWQGAVSLEHADQWVMPWRIPHEDRPLFAEGLVNHAAMSAGVRLAFRTDSRAVGGSIEPQPEDQRLELCCDGEVAGSVDLAGRDRFRFDGLAPQVKLVELWLPPASQFKLRRIELDEAATVQPHEDARPAWITYGSSITHCCGAESPTQTWPAIVARQKGLNLTCLGFGGQCHLDPMIARVMRDLPADFISMCVGINIYGGGSLNLRTFSPGIMGFVQIVREGHAHVPLVVISPIVAPSRESTPNSVGFTLAAMRPEVAAAVRALRECGDRNVHYLEGLEVLGPDLVHLLDDGCHPSAEGYRAMGERLSRLLADRFFSA